jgi:deoxyribodipyrimidine photolyase-related protein
MLPLFGSYQDAMSPNEWSLYHARISFSMNIKMISPQEVIASAIQEWEKRPDEIEYNQLEGFVRQIIGWREYMRGIYWLKMPDYASMNFSIIKKSYQNGFGPENQNALFKGYYKSVPNYGYAHHIQRMITGNFAL